MTKLPTGRQYKKCKYSYAGIVRKCKVVSQNTQVGSSSSVRVHKKCSIKTNEPQTKCKTHSPTLRSVINIKQMVE